MKELFEINETKSPRLKWLEKHEVRTHHNPNIPEAQWSAWLPAHDWSETDSGCYQPVYEDSVGFGDTKDEAIVEMAKANNIKLWNEQ